MPVAEPPPAETTREYFAQCDDWDRVAAVLCLVLEQGTIPKDFPQGEKWTFEFKLGLLRLAVSPTSGAEIQWEALEGKKVSEKQRDRCGLPDEARLPSREAYVEDFWRSTEDGGANTDLREWLVDRWGAFQAYERHLFGWFVRRFNLPAALRLGAMKRAWASYVVPWIFPVVAILMSWAILSLPPAPTFMGLLWAAVGMVLLNVLLWVFLDLRLAQILELFIPRLGGTVAIGYLFLAAAPQLVGLLFRWGERWRLQLLLAGGLLLVLFLYVMQHIARRVVPQPRTRSLVLRAATVTAIGVGHAAVGLVMFAPLLFSKEFLDLVSEGLYAPPRAHQLILCGAIALAIGVILELAWEDKPLTEPL